MLSCESCQAQLLEYVYEVVDAAERQALDSHLVGCPACAAGLAQALGQQTLLAAAARMEFPQVRFEAPAETPAVLPLEARRRQRRAKVLRWAAAAAVLLAAIGFPAIKLARDYREAQRIARQNEVVVAEARATMRQAVAKRQQVPHEAQRKFEAIEKAIREKKINLVVSGPATVEPGAPAQYQIQTTKLDGTAVTAKVEAQVMDGDKRVGEPIQVPGIGNGAYRLTLSPDVPVRPNNQLNLVVSAKLESGGATAEVREQLQLANPVFVTHLTTDKPMYQPGETVRFRSLTLNRANLKPASEEFRFNYTIATPTGEQHVILQGANQLSREAPGVAGAAKNQNNADPKQGPWSRVQGPDKKPIQGVGAGEFPLNLEAPGGEYTLTVRDENQRFPEQQRKFIVNRYQKPRLNKELDFSRKTYGAGDDVQATCKANRADGGPVAKRPVTATVQIDGQTYDAAGQPSAKPLTFTTDDQGNVLVRFKLPAKIDKGLASLAVTFDDGGNIETLVRPLPIVLKKVQVEFFPEGGDLVAGLNNRVYFQVKTTLDKPADVKGRVLEDGKPLPIEVATLNDAKEPGVNQGMGKFEFTPKATAKYELQIDSPVGVTERYALPIVHENKVVLRVPDGVFKADQEIEFQVQTDKKRPLMVGLYCRGRLLDSVRLPAGTTEAKLKPAAGMGGVCRVTVFEELANGGNRRDLQPVAERLIYRHPLERLSMVLRSNQKTYVPGQRANVTIEAANEKDEKAPAIVTLSVVDKSVVTLADEKTARSMPTHFLLTTEVRKPEDLEYADFLLTGHPKAAEALDLLLGTQGWRRFAEQDPQKFKKLQGAEAERLLVTIGQTEIQQSDSGEKEFEKVRTEMEERAALAEKQFADAQERERAALSAEDYKAATATLTSFQRGFEQARTIGTPIVAALLLLGILVFLVKAMGKGVFRAMVSYAAAGGCAALLVMGFRAHLEEKQMAGAKHAAERVATVAAPRPRDGEMNGEGVMGGGAGAGARPEAKWMDGAAKEMEIMDEKLPRALNAPGRPPAPAPKAGIAPMDGRQFGVRPQAAPAKNILGLDLQGLGADKERAEFAGREMQNRFALAPGFRPLGEERKQLAGKDQVRKLEQNLDRVQGQLDKAKDADMFRRGPMNRGLRARGAVALGEQNAAEGLPALPPMVVREYAHQRVAGASPEQRSDFAETLYWNPVLVLDGGKADVSFDLCDSVTTFQVTAFAHTLDGRLGSATYLLDSRLPLTVQPKMPIEVTSSDRIDIPLSVANNTNSIRKVEIGLKAHENLSLVGTNTSDKFDVPAGSSLRRIFRFKPTIKEGAAVLSFEGKTEGFAPDSIRNTFRIVPEGFPVTGSFSDVLEKTAVQTVNLPETWVKGTLKCDVNVYPSTLADLQKGLESLLREPGGCFEQTSTSNYPNLLILDYLRESDQAKPEVEKQARDMLARGYQKLTAFECPSTPKKAKEGFEWFGGQDQAHEALTAYGLLQFRDMARVQDVDPAMMKRTQDFLLSQRDGKGGFKRNARALDSFGRAPEDITNAYIVWALTEGGKEDDVTKEQDVLVEKCKTSKDPYFLSLVANGLLNRGRTADAMVLLKKVIAVQNADGHLNAETTSITGSGGRDLEIETTALAVLGWLKANQPAEFNLPIQKAVKWIAAQRGGYGGFGSTQSTILALKSLIAFTKANKKTPEGGMLKLFVGNTLVGTKEFPAGVSEALNVAVADAEKLLKPGKNELRVEITGKNVFPYTLGWTYQTLQPVSADNCPVKLETKLAKANVAEGEVVRLNVKVENVTDKGQGMAVAIIGLPGGLIVPEDMKQLKEFIRLPEDGTRPLVGAFEIRGRELVLYWRDLAPKQKIEVPIDLICRVPGEYSGPASRAYLYYNADKKHWVEPLKATVTAKAD